MAMKQVAVISFCFFFVLSTVVSIAPAARYDPEVYQTQKALKEMGYNPGKSNSLYDKSTESAVKKFQRDYGLPVTGKLDAQTREKLGLSPSNRFIAQKKERRVALVIGNSLYRHTPALRNPVNDANAITIVLRELNFDVGVGYDLEMSNMVQRILSFGRKAQNADVGVVFYAGHAVQFEGQNYLLPVSAKLRDELDLKTSALSLDLVMTALERVRGIRIVIFDACRDNPLIDRLSSEMHIRSASVRRGLAIIKTSTDVLVAYATKENAVANDGEDSNSPYTQALLNHIATPGLEIRMMFGRVRDDVLVSTSHRQQPFTYGSLGGREWYFKPAARIIHLPPEPKSVAVGPQYEMDDLIPFKQKLLGSIDGLSYEIKLDDNVHLLKYVGDFNLDGYNDALMMKFYGGNCCPGDYYFVVYKGNGYFHITDSFVSSWSTPVIEPWRGKYSLVAEVNNYGINVNPREQEVKRFILDNTGMVKLVESHSKQYVRAVIETTVSEGPDRLYFDIDGDGSKEYISCGFWERWGVMIYCALFNADNRKIQDFPFQPKRIGFLNHKTNGKHDIVCDFDQIWVWDQGRYVEKTLYQIKK